MDQDCVNVAGIHVRCPHPGCLFSGIQRPSCCPLPAHLIRCCLHLRGLCRHRRGLIAGHRHSRCCHPLLVGGVGHGRSCHSGCGRRAGSRSRCHGRRLGGWGGAGDCSRRCGVRRRSGRRSRCRRRYGGWRLCRRRRRRDWRLCGGARRDGCWVCGAHTCRRRAVTGCRVLLEPSARIKVLGLHGSGTGKQRRSQRRSQQQGCAACHRRPALGRDEVMQRRQGAASGPGGGGGPSRGTSASGTRPPALRALLHCKGTCWLLLPSPAGAASGHRRCEHAGTWTRLLWGALGMRTGHSECCRVAWGWLEGPVRIKVVGS